MPVCASLHRRCFATLANLRLAITGRRPMLCRVSIGVLALAAALVVSGAGVRAFDDAQYPDWHGAWHRLGNGSFDGLKPAGLGQQAPLTPEDQTILETSLADQANGGRGGEAGSRRASHGKARGLTS